MKKIFLLSFFIVFVSGCGASVPTESSYPMSDVQAAHTREKCWAAIGGNVYDLTAWISEHPGGEKKILSICGTDGTDAFIKQHGSQAAVAEILKDFKIGTLK